jgi:hypothetical protein
MLNKVQAISYIDVLTVVLAVFAALYFASNDDTGKGNIKDKSEFIVQMDWEDGSLNDVDLWVSNPFGDVVNFKNKNVGLMTLDWDNLGTNNSFTIDKDGKTISNKSRREVVAIRAIMPGTFVVNSMMYKNHTQKPEKVKVTILKLNPYKEIVSKEIVLDHVGQTFTIASFQVNPNGDVLAIDTVKQVNLGTVK